MNISPLIRFVLLFVIFLFPSRLVATDCSVPSSFNEAILESDEIFLAKLLKIKPVKYFDRDSGPPGILDSGWYDYELIFDIQKKWKGSLSNRVSVFIDGLCPPVFTLPDSSYFWLHEFNKEITEYQYIIYAERDKSRLEEIIIGATNHTTNSLEIPGYRIVSSSSNRTLGTKNPSSDSLFISEIAKLDTIFVQPIALVPYYFNLSNFLYLIAFSLGLIIIRKNLKARVFKKRTKKTGKLKDY